MDFRKPLAAGLVCPNYDSVMGSIEYPNEARHRRINSGSVTIDFVMKADGEITEFRVIRSTHGTFTAAALLALVQLKCNGVGRDITVRVPFGFRLQ
jgi:protein TonB